MCHSPPAHSRRRPFHTLPILRLWACFYLLVAYAMAQEEKSAADYYVSSLPGQPDGPLLKMHAGHIEVNEEHNGNLFFWHFQNRHIANRQRTVIWLNGGPGCSSMDGALMEIGPYRVLKDGQLRYNNGSWDEFANLLFIDNPVGTGFSYVNTDSFVHELKEMADQMVTFLKKFFALFPEYEDNDLYIAGESYAGQHIPYIAKAIQFNNNLPIQSKVWKLSGLLIGNGWISPREQYNSYIPMALKSGIVKEGSDQEKSLQAQQDTCTKLLNEPGGDDKVNVDGCESVLQMILKNTQKDEKCYNMYDLRLRDSFPSCGMNWPPDLETVTPYLRRQDVVQALHISKDKKSGWTECSGAVGSNFNPKSVPSVQILPEILQTMPVLLFSGDQDLICNHMGTEELIHNMEWNGGKGFELSPGTWAPRKHWTFEGEPAGLYQEARNLTYVLFYNSSHMVPFDYPRRTRDMLDRFLGVDIASIGGNPADSRLDGQKGVETSVGGHPNSTKAIEDEAEKLEEAKWAAYYKSGEVALVVVIILASVWGFYVWRDRRRRADYSGLFGGSNTHLPTKRQGRDVETADFDESELDDLHVASPAMHGDGAERYSVGGNSDDEDEKGKSSNRTNGHPTEKVKPYRDGKDPS